MRKLLAMLLLVTLVATLVIAVGCGGSKTEETTIKTPEGEVQVEEKDGRVTYETEEGKVTYEGSEGAPSEAELGAPVYPDAEYVEGSGGTATATGEEGEFTTAGAEFVTEDSYAKVVDFYTGKLGAPMYEDTTSKEATWMINANEESFTVVTVSEEEGKVKISIGRMAGKSNL
ncbi:MAG: hypothetical protein HPY75_11885 [Actinobacteria bacterium]|nr:hypothetical protein [Actinomycetota bacterium]